MANPKGLVVNIDDVHQELDLKKLTGVETSKDPELQREIAQSVVDYMVNRAEDGLGLNGVKLKSPYSKAYSKSQDFEAAGKSANQVNMRLSGDMLSNIDVIDEADSKVVIGFADKSQIPKAYNHQIGDTVPRRPFFGIGVSEFKENILPKFKKDLEKLKESEPQSKKDQQGKLIKAIRKASEFFD